MDGLPYFVQYVLWRHKERETFAQVYLKLIEAYNWTPKQISHEVTIAQFLSLWLYKEQVIEDGASVMRGLQEERRRKSK